ncbi:HDR113Cp [Eremothecium sinecaudum]|uniref:DASH complex subunit ASK1 n=1 Tax=Eremothecium sinecaudum TaxID=45286 RepID=A0A0X8HSX9_9SACH|nr:HDR113Cp [Eremothecium sinecaudum]AMD20855.1 HDR113Cp [Eremothecium sinecaudum]
MPGNSGTDTIEAGEPTMEQLDQEITLQLQKIDSNLSCCFNKITKEIIPHVTRYGAVCEDTLSSCSWLKEMFQKSADVQLLKEGALEEEEGKAGDGQPGATESIFPADEALAAAVARVKENVDVTTTGQVLAIPLSSDEDEVDAVSDKVTCAEDQDDNSTLQRQQKRRKLSLMLQQRYGSSSSSFVSRSPTMERTFPRLAGSSPNRDAHADNVSGRQDESTKEVQPPTRTVIRFQTEEGT